ncbi:MAG: hypothetical protein ACKVWV_02140 [Planctomycetota bacterium]
MYHRLRLRMMSERGKRASAEAERLGEHLLVWTQAVEQLDRPLRRSTPELAVGQDQCQIVTPLLDGRHSQRVRESSCREIGARCECSQVRIRGHVPMVDDSSRNLRISILEEQIHDGCLRSCVGLGVLRPRSEMLGGRVVVVRGECRVGLGQCANGALRQCIDEGTQIDEYSRSVRTTKCGA